MICQWTFGNKKRRNRRHIEVGRRTGKHNIRDNPTWTTCRKQGKQKEKLRDTGKEAAEKVERKRGKHGIDAQRETAKERGHARERYSGGRVPSLE